jgi:type I restriction enzyme M protein
MPANTTEVEKRLWEAADELRANSQLKSSEYSLPVLGLIFLRYADYKFTQAQADLAAPRAQTSRRRTVGKADYHARGVLFLPESARFTGLLGLPEGTDIAWAISDAMKAIEQENPELSEVLPRDYHRTHDLLLPKLISGELDVAALDVAGVMG